MAVIKTQPWLYQFVEACKKKSLSELYFNQCETICHPVKKTFTKITPEELHYLLLKYGMFEPDEWKEIPKTVRKMEERHTWKVVEQEYKRLKKKWNGPESFIYIFPIKHVHLPDRKRAIQKNGVSFKEGIFLFLSPDIPLVEIKALLAHEYNHVCRLAYLKLDEKNIPLKESLIIEGLGEYAVKELYGEERLGPWTRLYQNKNVIGIWERGFLPDLNVKGLDKHSLFLYGQGNDKFPKWIGYYFGFQIVESYDERYGPLCIRELLTKTADELIAGSNLPLE